MHLDPFLYLFDDYIWYLRTVNKLAQAYLLLVPEQGWTQEFLQWFHAFKSTHAFKQDLISELE